MRPSFTLEQREAWVKAKALLKTLSKTDTIRYRSLHIAMSELRGRYRTHKGPIEAISSNPQKATQRKSLDAYHKVRERTDVWVKYLDNPGTRKLFVIVDDSLSESHKAVQAVHAVAQFQKEHPFAPWINGTLVLLTIDRSDKRSCNLLDLWDRHSYSFDYKTQWCEEDLENKLTAIVFLDDYIDINHRVRGIKLM